MSAVTHYIVQCTDRSGLQSSSTFDVPEDAKNSVLRYGLREAVRLCGHFNAIASAFISTIDGHIVGTLR